MNVKKLGVAAVLAAGLGVSGAAQANLIQNGGFETCDAGGNAAGWTYTAATDTVNCLTDDTLLAQYSPPDTDPYAGAYMLELKGDRDRAASQTFVGEGIIKVKFAFRLAALDFISTEDGADWFRVLVDGTQYFSESINDPMDNNQTWTTTNWRVVQFYTSALTAGTHTLQFCLDTASSTTEFYCLGGNSGALNPTLAAYVDEVYVPEPGSLALLGLGLLGLGLARRKAA